MTGLALRVAAGVAVVVALLACLNWWTSSIDRRGYERGRAEVQALRDKDTAARAQEDADRAIATLRQSEFHRDEEARREAAKQKEVDRAQLERRHALAAAAAADRAAVGLRDQLATFVSDARSRAAAAADSGAIQPGQAAGTELELLANVLRGVEQAGRAMAAEADAYRSPGVTAERSYDALTPAP
jgi:hypothetical protein